MQNIQQNKILLVLAIVCWHCYSFSQSKEQLEKKREDILKDLQYNQKLLKETKKSKQITIADLSAINKQIELRQNLINNTQSQVNLFNQQIVQQQEVANTKSKELDQAKKEYAYMLLQTYKYNRFTSKLLFIINAKSFAEALRRIQYLRKYAVMRKNQVEKIIATSKELQQSIVVTNTKKQEKEKMLHNQLDEKQQLNKTQQIKNKLVFELKQEEKKLQTTITKKQTEANKLNNQIAAIIKKEIEEAKKKAAAELAAKKQAEKDKLENSTTTTKTTTPVKVTETPEYDKLTNNFLGNKGKLPWPVDKGFISKSFGKYTHPDLPSVVIENNGIDIRTDANANARVVFEGTVVGILNNPTFKNAVIVSHGDYFTVYSKLSTVSVSKGQKLSTKQQIGTVFTNEDSETEIHFEVWNGSDKLNPSYWIYKR